MYCEIGTLLYAIEPSSMLWDSDVNVHVVSVHVPVNNNIQIDELPFFLPLNA